MGEGGRIWITRGQPGAEATAARLRALGHAPLVASLLEVRPLPPPAELPKGVAALAFTSANAVRAFSAWTPRREWPVFAVGGATAEAAREAGFRAVSSADGDVGALALRIAAERCSGLVLHPCAREAAGDLAGALGATGLRSRAASLRDLRRRDLPTGVCAALDQGAIPVALIHSPKAARALAGLWVAAGRPRLQRTQLLGLSPACLAPVAHLPFAAAHAPTQPNETAMLDLL